MATVPGYRKESQFKRWNGPKTPVDDLARQPTLGGPQVRGGPPGALATPIPDPVPKLGVPPPSHGALNPNDLKARPS